MFNLLHIRCEGCSSSVWASSRGSSRVRFNRTDAAIPQRPTCHEGRAPLVDAQASDERAGLCLRRSVRAYSSCTCTLQLATPLFSRVPSYLLHRSKTAPFCWPLCWTCVPDTLTHPSASHRSFFTCLFVGNDGTFAAVAGALARHLV